MILAVVKQEAVWIVRVLDAHREPYQTAINPFSSCGAITAAGLLWLVPRTDAAATLGGRPACPVPHTNHVEHFVIVWVP